MTDFEYLTITDTLPVRRVTLNRPEVHNAFNDGMVAELTRAFEEAGTATGIRVVVLAGAGKSFSAGADLNWMQSMISYTFEENVRDAHALADMFDAIYRCQRPVIARVQGAALGGGAGLVAVVDIAIAAESAHFAFSEVRLGIVPAVISPYVLRRIGEAHARELFLTGERFGATRAREIGLVAHVAGNDQLDQEIEHVIGEIVRSGPEAVATAKRLIAAVTRETEPGKLADITARIIAERRASDEGQAGMRAFLAKQPPPWRADGN